MDVFEFRGVDNLYAAEVLQDDENGFVCDTPFKLAPVAEVGRSTESSSEAHYYDNKAMIVVNSEGADTIKPQSPFSVPFKISTPTLTTVKGVPTKTYTEGETIYFGTFKTFGGTESVKDGLYSVIDTATLETWYTPVLKADCRVNLLESGELYEVVGTPEDIQKRHQYMKARLQAVKGGA